MFAFTGSVGEHSPTVRRRAAQRLGLLGVAIDTHRIDTHRIDTHRIDTHRNDTVHDDSDITAAPATVQTVVITAREDLQIAREARRLLAHGTLPSSFERS